MLEVIAGPMFSGKSEELVRRLTRHQIGRRSVIAYKPQIDNRYDEETIVSHSGFAFKCYPLPIAFAPEDEMPFSLVSSVGVDVIGIDEAQFFGEWILGMIDQWVNDKKIVIVAGLDKTYRGEPFTNMPTLLALADSVTKLTAVCHSCGNEASMTQRLIDGAPAPFSGPTVQVGGIESYEARCRDCFEKR